MIIADTIGLYAIFNRRQPEHQPGAVERDGGPLVLSPLVLAERADRRVDRGAGGAP